MHFQATGNFEVCHLTVNWIEIYKWNIKFSCQWKNSQCLFEKHFINSHKEFPVLSFNDKAEFYCNLNESTPLPFIKSFRLINAFSKSFGLYFLLDKKAKLLSIVIFLIGKIQVANQFFYTLTVKSADNQYKVVDVHAFRQLVINILPEVQHCRTYTKVCEATSMATMNARLYACLVKYIYAWQRHPICYEQFVCKWFTFPDKLRNR